LAISPEVPNAEAFAKEEGFENTSAKTQLRIPSSGKLYDLQKILKTTLHN